ncbi:MAG: NAD(P)-binding domain-containing protein [Gammaproteobacteria bacterium]|nr:NAD(P)-binding domain-containing protein [Gammaproteobacteria bacterium]MBU1556819.1 NAD(P)-binding domain-containing protein [Gammaproteobacteria bacterium]MBU2072096.1 NAD(P)-binding domain-containing protein [Gammaproteobacteria bacterium]MBU2183517.1 NAD(P)-binding domain-containing protein [Gammaproteobacteria bacterium]MBU2203427.1 NAD(P)-binding domain-containing protein [Gammaproteobacteria bacterium]
MKIVIVGCGWLGTQLAAALSAAGHQVYASRRQAQNLVNLPDAVRPLLLDLSADNTTSQVYAALEGAIVICAIPAGSRSGATGHYADALSRLTLLMQQAGSLAAIHFSSSGIYQGLSGDVDETAALRMDIERVALLANGEQILQQGIPLCITLRLAGLIGPGRHPGRFVAGKEVANPEGFINMLHADDACRAVQQLLNCQTLQSARYNLSCPLAVTRRQFYQAACNSLQAQVSFSDDKLISHRALAEQFTQHFAFQYRFANAIDALTYCD